MRILLACEFYYPSVGGVQEVIRQLAERLVEHGHRVTVATSYLPERRFRELNGVSIKEFRIFGNLVHGMKGEIEAYQTYVLEDRFDVLMIKAAQQWTFDALIPVLHSITKPKIFIPCGFSSFYEPEYQGYYRQMPDALRKFDHLIFYASDYRDIDFARDHGMSNYTIVPNGASEREFRSPADHGFRQRHGIPENAFVLLTVGSQTGQKGHREVAEAFEIARFSDRPAVLILNGNRTGFLQKVTAIWRAFGVTRVIKWIIRTSLIRLNLGWVLRIMGYSVQVPMSLDMLVSRINRAGASKRAMLVNLPRVELVQAYLNSDLFVFASNIEYSPLVLYEAAAASLPFLSLPVGNAEEIARWTGGGEICPAVNDAKGYTRVDPVVLAEHIMRLAGDSERLSHLGTMGRRNWEEQFSWDKIAMLYEKIFERCVQQSD